MANGPTTIFTRNYPAIKQAASKAFVGTLLDEDSLVENVSISLVPYGGWVRVPDELEHMLEGTPPTQHWADGVWNNCFFLAPNDYNGGVGWE